MYSLNSFPEVDITITTKDDGDMHGYEMLYALLGKKSLIVPRHQHSTDTWVVTDENSFQVEPLADIILTKEKHLAITHKFADCVPVLCLDRKQKVMCFSHFGWKGLVMGGVKVALLSLQAQYHSSLSDIWIWIGPCIQKESYVFSSEPMQTKFSSWTEYVTKLSEKDEWSIDLSGFVIGESIRFGIDLARVINDGQDTFMAPDVFFSHQRYTREEDEKDKGVFAVSCSLL